MDRLIVNTGGVGIRQDDLTFIQNMTVNSSTDMGKVFNSTGKPKIFSGCVLSGTAVSDGSVIDSNGEIYQYSSVNYGASPNALYWDLLSVDDSTRNYKYNTPQNFHRNRTAVLTATPTTWSGATSITYAASLVKSDNRSNRTDTQISTLLDNTLGFLATPTGDYIYTNSGSLNIQSYFDSAIANTYINQWDGDVWVGGSSGVTATNGVLRINKEVHMIGKVNMIETGITTSSLQVLIVTGQTINYTPTTDTIYYIMGLHYTGTYFGISFLIHGKQVGQWEVAVASDSVGPSCTIICPANQTFSIYCYIGSGYITINSMRFGKDQAE